MILRIFNAASSFDNFEIQRYSQNKPKFTGLYSRHNLSKNLKDGAYVINLDESADVGSHCIAFYVLHNDATYFDSFGVEHSPKEIKRFVGNKTIQTKIFRIQSHDSVMWEYSRTGFIHHMFAGKTLINYNACFRRINF